MSDIQIVSLTNFQSVIQLAAGLSFAFSVFPQLSGSAEAIYERTRRELDERLARHLRYADKATAEIEASKVLSPEKRKALEGLLVASSLLKSDVARAEKEIKSLRDGWSRYSQWFLGSCLFWGILATIALFVSSLPPVYFADDITSDQARDLNELFFKVNATLCAFLFLPVAGAIWSGFVAQWRVKRICKQLYLSMDDLAGCGKTFPVSAARDSILV